MGKTPKSETQRSKKSDPPDAGFTASGKTDSFVGIADSDEDIEIMNCMNPARPPNEVVIVKFTCP
jgi:hypothetical protein